MFFSVAVRELHPATSADLALAGAIFSPVHDVHMAVL
jgi:hypothetical protein